MSAMHEFIKHRIKWLQGVTGIKAIRHISRAHLPRILLCVDRKILNEIVFEFFHVDLSDTDWIAVDGKALRGSPEERQAVISCVKHGTGEQVALAEQSDAKTNEIPVVRKLLFDSKLGSKQITLDAMHCNPESLQPITFQGGVYLTALKGNQPDLYETCARIVLKDDPDAKSFSVDKGHGRITERTAKLFCLETVHMDARWYGCRPKYLIALTRKTTYPATGEVQENTKFYITNKACKGSVDAYLAEMCTVIRGHWIVESDNWCRDVILGEDDMRISDANLAQTMATLRSLGMCVARQITEKITETLRAFTLSPPLFKKFLKKIKFS
jgi:predicted transposase YbfD/YdcC